MAAESKDVDFTPDPQDHSQRHPLQHQWTMYYDPPKGKGGGNWKDNVKKVLAFDTVEDFWCMYNNLRKPSELATGSNYHMFKEDVFPEWEDPRNKRGGKWVFTPRAGQDLDELWLNTILAMIGELFEHADEICGAVVSKRSGGKTKICLWTKNADEEVRTREVGRQWKKALELAAIEYQAHSEAMATGSSFSNGALYRIA